ncbi:LTA synthase family protein [Sulfurimonas sp. HSL1-6]|uniref:LTA synthase family protein n=1 Tax=Thiomicrolovo immobilis TaxID=3131935 RepID=UPI0031F833E2
MIFLRNYFTLFALAYLLLASTKLLFLAFYADRFGGYPFASLLHALVWGYRFDFAAAAIVTLFATLGQFNARLLHIGAALLLGSLVMLQLSDILYFEDASRHIAYEITDVFNDAGGLFMTALGQNTLFTLTALTAVPLMVWGFYRFGRARLHPVPLDRYYLPKTLLLLGLSVFFIRGMFAHIPLTPWQSSQIGDARLAQLALNGSYSALFSLVDTEGRLLPRRVAKLSPREVKRGFAEIYDDGRTVTGMNATPNVIFFFLEGWSGVNMQPYGHALQTTPFFDSILPRSLRPKAAIAGGHRTTEGMFTTLVSYQNPLARSVAKTQLQNFRYRSVIDLFNARGYRSIFFQGTAKETSGTGALAQKLGFSESYGKEDVTERRFGTNFWGVYDQDLYAFALQKLGESSSPFVLGINGATTHDDKLPEGVGKTRFADDEKQNNRLNALHFADAALGEFVAAVQARYPNTLFVFFADHCGGGVDGTFENFMIPLAFYGASIAPHYLDHYVSQRDIAPTVVDIVFGDYKKLMPDFSGKSLVSDHHFVADYYRNGILGWVEGMQAVEYLADTGEVTCYDVSRYRAEPAACERNSEDYTLRAAAFTDVSQRLLFAGETDRFHTYRAARPAYASLAGRR